MKHIKKIIKGKKYIQLSPVIGESKTAALLEAIMKRYIELMYSIQIMEIEGYLYMPDDQTSKADWMKRKVEKIQSKIIEKLKEETNEDNKC